MKEVRQTFAKKTITFDAMFTSLVWDIARQELCVGHCDIPVYPSVLGIQASGQGEGRHPYSFRHHFAGGAIRIHLGAKPPLAWPWTEDTCVK